MQNENEVHNTTFPMGDKNTAYAKFFLQDKAT